MWMNKEKYKRNKKQMRRKEEENKRIHEEKGRRKDELEEQDWGRGVGGIGEGVKEELEIGMRNRYANQRGKEGGALR